MLRYDNVVSEAAVREGRTLHSLGIQDPLGIESIVPAYLEQYRPKGQYSHYRG
jgi:NADH dehydrogenase